MLQVKVISHLGSTLDLKTCEKLFDLIRRDQTIFIRVSSRVVSRNVPDQRILRHLALHISLVEEDKLKLLDHSQVVITNFIKSLQAN